MRLRNLIPGIALLLLSGCTGIPKGVEPVGGFQLERYLGRWYEIARLDHSFERGLIKVTAEYSLREDGGVRVVNRGYDPQKNIWKQVEGRAYFVAGPDVGRLKVSFFGPFYGGYNILELDQKDYGYALVAGPTRSYLWILAREPRLDKAVVRRLTDRAAQMGFPVDELIFVEHTTDNAKGQ
ncbi:lipocalin family protein [Desulfonatronum thioautotrophicum]|uniref:lipocalin family protein n=1 Tax=Desulfonatronum thioautotrophicum TaxID=617001 RepID=UPI000AE13B0C|nr:lipocalin family protein [Desulfonatronum thioautotrophicum]